ncbi:MAG: DUF952 domain-containing protein [Acidobacteria bacterium]|nr:DUF952 domain-containing protein [Acidobacteriota bacterium]
MHIFHVILPKSWEEQRSGDTIIAESLAGEGFIHCSLPEQLDGVLDRYFDGVSKVVVLTIDSERLSSDLVFEPSTNGEGFPHIYGPINIDSIVHFEERIIGPDR